MHIWPEGKGGDDQEKKYTPCILVTYTGGTLVKGFQKGEWAGGSGTHL